MNKILFSQMLLGVLIIAALPAKSQNQNFAKHSALDYAGGIVSVNHKSFYTEEIIGECCSLSLNVVGIDNGGAEFWRKSIIVDEYNEQLKLISGTDKNLVLLGKGEGCDVLRNKNIFAKIDTTGNFIFQNLIEPNDIIIDFAEYSDGTYYLISSTKLFHYSSSGTSLGQISHTLTGLANISVLNNGNLLLNCNTGTNYNVEMSTTGNVINKVQCLNTYTKFQQSSNGSIYGLDAGGVLSKFNPALVLQSSANSNIGINLKISDFTISQDSIYVAGYVVTNNKPFYAVLNTNFNMLHQPQSTAHTSITPTGITINKSGKIRILTRGRSNVFPEFSFTGLFQMNKNGNYYSGPDVGITNLKMLYANASQSLGNYWLVGNANVTVKNYSADTVKSCYLNYLTRNFLCINTVHKLINSSMAPGDSLVVNTGSFLINMPVASNTNTPLNLSTCFFTSIPNYKNDINIANDSKCVTYTVQVGLSENILNDKAFNVSPNPAGSSVLIEGSEDIQSLYLMDLTGKVFFNKMCDTNTRSISLNPELTPGIYLLKIQTKKGTITKKFIQE